MADDFFTVFRKSMSVLGLPAPASLFGTLVAANSTLMTIAGAVHKLGSKVTVREVFLTIPALSTGAVKVAGGLVEVGVALAGCTASFYLGAATGCLITTADEVYGGGVFAKMGDGLIELVGATGAVDPRLLHTLETCFPNKRAARMLALAQSSVLPGRSIMRGASGPRRWGR